VKSYRDVEEDEDEGGTRKRSRLNTDSSAVASTPGSGKSGDVDTAMAAASTRGLGSGCMSFNTVRRKRIEQLHIVTGEVLRRYDSGSEAAAFMEISQSGISLCCMGKKLDSNGFRWRFYDGELTALILCFHVLFSSCLTYFLQSQRMKSSPCRVRSS
jgi:hypothetical protein